MWPLGRKTEKRDNSFTVGGSPRLVVRSENGPIQLRHTPSRTISVEATLRKPSRLQYEVSKDGDSVTVELGMRRGFSPGGAGRADLQIMAPSDTVVDLETNFGRLVVEGMMAGCQLRTLDGPVELERMGGSVDVKTNDGDIEVSGLDGTAKLISSNGSVRLNDVRGSVDVTAVNGKISFSGELPPGTDSRLHAIDEDITVKLQGTPSVKLDVSATNGRVITSLPIVATAKETHDIIGTLGDGEAELTIRAVNGSVSIE